MADAVPRAGRYTWEEAVEILRKDPEHQRLIFDAYLTANLAENCRRFRTSAEFDEVQRLIRQFAPGSKHVVDIPGGNGIATVAFALAGYEVTAVEPDPSTTVGRRAIELSLQAHAARAEVVTAYGESLPFEDGRFDVVYVRQGLHHARDLPRMVHELARVLRPDGLLVACREHVVDNYGDSLQSFLRSQADHQLYGGENAFTLVDYKRAFTGARLDLLLELGPYDSVINIYPNDSASLRQKILNSAPGRILGQVLPEDSVVALGMRYLKARNAPGRLFSFVLQRPS